MDTLKSSDQVITVNTKIDPKWTFSNLCNIEYVNQISFSELCVILESELQNLDKSNILKMCNEHIQEYYDRFPRLFEEELNKKQLSILAEYDLHKEHNVELLHYGYTELATAPLDYLIYLKKKNDCNETLHQELHIRVCRSIVIDYYSRLTINIANSQWVDSLSLSDLFYYTNHKFLNKINLSLVKNRQHKILAKCKLEMSNDDWTAREVLFRSKINAKCSLDQNEIDNLPKKKSFRALTIDKLFAYLQYVQSNKVFHNKINSISSILDVRITQQVKMEYLTGVNKSYNSFINLEMRFNRLINKVQIPFTDEHRFNIHTSLVRGLQLDIKVCLSII